MPKVFQLGYVAMGVKDIAKSRDYYTKVMGTSEIERGEDGTSYFSVGLNHHDLVLRPQTSKELLHLGFQLNTGTNLSDFLKEARAFGLKADIQSDPQPGIAQLIDIEVTEGNRFQFYNDIEMTAPGFTGRGIAPLRLGHVAVISPDADKLIAFYRDFLGFWQTDWIGDLANFLTCNHEHHVVNVVKAPESRIHHIAFQLRESAEHARAADTIRSAGIKTEWGPSRHTAGHNLAAYHFDPERTLIELYTDMDVWIPELNMCEQRPWHEDLPMRPKHWDLAEMSNWDVDFSFDLAKA